MTTEERKTYNGWTNYETWAVKLWIDNEEPSYNYWRETTREVWSECEERGNAYLDTRQLRAQSMLAERLKEELDDQAEVEIHVHGRKVDASFYNDLMNAALGEVNWHEIADSMLADMEEES